LLLNAKISNVNVSTPQTILTSAAREGVENNYGIIDTIESILNNNFNNLTTHKESSFFCFEIALSGSLI